MTAPEQNRSVEQIESDLEATRSDLEATVDELTSRLDVKEQAKRRAAHGKSAVTHQVQRARAAATDERGRLSPEAVSVLATVSVVLVASAVALWRRG